MLPYDSGESAGLARGWPGFDSQSGQPNEQGYKWCRDPDVPLGSQTRRCEFKGESVTDTSQGDVLQ